MLQNRLNVEQIRIAHYPQLTPAHAFPILQLSKVVNDLWPGQVLGSTLTPSQKLLRTNKKKVENI